MKSAAKESDKEFLLALANVVVSTCSQEEIDMLCIALLDANMKVKRKNIKEQEEAITCTTS